MGMNDGKTQMMKVNQVNCYYLHTYTTVYRESQEVVAHDC